MRIAILASVLLMATVITSSESRASETRMDEPFGSRYIDYEDHKVWLHHAGVNSDGGWPTSRYPKFIEDINNDGRADVVAFGANDVWVAISDGTKFQDFYRSIHHFGYYQEWRVDKHRRFVADLNGDGFKDVFGYGPQGVYAALNNKNQDQPEFSGFKLWTTSFGANERGGFYLNENFIRTTADINADKMADLVVFADDGVYVALSNGDGFDPPQQWIDNFGTNAAWNETYKRHLSDIDGDGDPDIIGYGMQGVYAAINNRVDGFKDFGLWTREFVHYQNEDFIRTTADVNGDNKADLVVFADNGVLVALSNGSSFDASSRYIDDYGTAKDWGNTNHLRVLADVNGDRMADIIGFKSDGTYFSMSVGESFKPAQKWVADFGYAQGWRIGEHPRFLRDVNGDGVLDLTGYGNDGVDVSQSAPLYCCDETRYNNGNGGYVEHGYFARVHLQRLLDEIVMPQRDPNTCGSSDAMHPVVKNSGAPHPWLNQSWREILAARYVVNANFFELKSGDIYDWQCANGIGLSISDGQLLSDYSKFKERDTDVLLIYNEQAARDQGVFARIIPGKDIGDSWRGKVRFAISGVQLVREGRALTGSAPDPSSARARNAVGLTEDGATLIFLTQNAGHDDGDPSVSTPLEPLAKALIRLGAHTALNLDGSGSAQMWFKNSKTEFKSEPSDRTTPWAPDGPYRPVPVVFGIK